jgi:Ala-tRNA(Pro) deacylase
MNRPREDPSMVILPELKELLDTAKVSYEIYSHRSAFTAQETAQTLHDSGKQMAKVVVINVDGAFVMVVIPGDRLVDLRKAARLLRAREVVRIATEDEFAALFPRCEVGAMPPFGDLFGLPMLVDFLLAEQREIFFKPGNHRQTVRLAYSEYKRLTRPFIADLSAAAYPAAA